MIKFKLYCLSKRLKAVTIVELLLYLVITVTMLTSVSGAVWLVLLTRAKTQTISEVEQQGVAAIAVINQAVRLASSVNTPTIGASGDTLSLANSEPAKNPTIFFVSGGTLQIKEGTNEAVDLTNSQVIVSNLNFQNLGMAGTKGNIRTSFTVAYKSTSNRIEYNFSKTFYGSASPR